MAHMMNPGQLRRATPVARVVNSYESLYFRAVSGDASADEIVRREMMRAFKEEDIVLDDKPSSEELNRVLVKAYAAAVEEIQGAPVTEAQRDELEGSLDTFEATHARFHETTFKSFEQVSDGMTVDFDAEVARFERETGDPRDVEMDEERLDEMEATHRASSGLSYSEAGATLEVARATFTSRKEAERLERENREVRDAAYDEYARNRKDTASRHTAGDDFGFDEREDDGPSL